MALICGPTDAPAALILDQESLQDDAGTAVGVDSESEVPGGRAMTFTVGQPGMLKELWVRMSTGGNSSQTPLLLDIRATEGGFPVNDSGPVYESFVFPASVAGSLPDRGEWVVMPLDGIAVQEGDLLAVVAQSDGGEDLTEFIWHGGFRDPYPRGQVYLRQGMGSGDWTRGTSFDLMFRTFVNVVPTPATLPLAAFACLGLMGRRRR